MNIFCLDADPVVAAQYHCDKHNVKMVLESAQLLCTTFHLQNIEAPYRKTHQNHPSAIWARTSLGNFEWLLEHSEALSKEYSFRYGKIHKTSDVISWAKRNKHLLSFDSKPQTEFSIAISANQNCRQHPNFAESSVIDKYRLYYKLDKVSFCSWTKRETPKWFNC